MKPIYLTFLLLLLVASTAGAQQPPPPPPPPTTLLQKQPDGSILITPENAWAIIRGRCADYNNTYLNTEMIAKQLWPGQLFAITDQFAHHDALAKYEHLLDDATANAKSIGDVTFIFYQSVGNYDFDAQAYPVGQYGNDGSRHFVGSTYVTFERTLASKIPMPEAQAKTVAGALQTDNGFVEVIVKGTIKACRGTTPQERGQIMGWQPKQAEEEPTGDMYKIILTVHSVEYRLKTQGTVLLSKSFDNANSPAPTSAVAPAAP